MKKRSQINVPVEVSDHVREIADAEEPHSEPPAKLDPSKGFASAHTAEEIELDNDFARIVERVFVEKPLEVYEQLEAALRVGEKRSDYGTMMKALDEAEANARLAHRLYITSRVEHEKWLLDNQVIMGAMWTRATAALQREKDAGVRNKAIQDTDVRIQCSLMFEDEFKAQEVKKAKVKAMEESMKNLAELWASRCRSLQTMLSKQR